MLANTKKNMKQQKENHRNRISPKSTFLKSEEKRRKSNDDDTIHDYKFQITNQASSYEEIIICRPY
jgi:hypothetical protein